MDQCCGFEKSVEEIEVDVDEKDNRRRGKGTEGVVL